LEAAVAVEPTHYYFDEFCLDVVRGVLSQGRNSVLDLRPKSFALLHLLVHNPDKLFSRSDLLQSLWPDVVVSDDSLTQCVGDLRRAFGERAPHVLKTVPRRGYILIAGVRAEIADKSIAPQPAPQVSSLTDTSACLILDAVAPLTTGVTTDLARTLTADLMMELTKFETVRIAGTSGPPAASYRVRSELRVAKGKIRIDARLEDAASGVAVWAEAFEKPAADDPEIPEGIVELLAATVIRQTDREDLRRARLKNQADLTAREFYLIGRDHHQRGTRDDTLIALSMFERAISLAPDFALPHAWQAYTIHRVVTHDWGPPIDVNTARERALAYARRAVQLEPDSPLCLSRLAFILLLHQRWDEAIETARAALQIARPSDYATRNTCCEVLAHTGHPQEAAEGVRRALSLDPHCPPTTRSLLGRALLMSGEPELALPELRWCAARLPDYAPCYHSMIVAAFETGRMDEAQHALREAIRLQPNWIPQNQTGLWFFRFERDAERFKIAFRAAGWVEADPPAGDPAVKEAGRTPLGGFITSGGRPRPDLRATKPLGNA
jgi:DNA-binding winged helix-turn-helix (wHTH) protein/tetratricopeptide (TPR) repeat protein